MFKEELFSLIDSLEELYQTEQVSDKQYSLPKLCNLIQKNHDANSKLWINEEVARSDDIENSKIVNAKRKIDSLNQIRNDCVELINNELVSLLLKDKINLDDFEKFNSESFGSIIDRFSIMYLKHFYMFQLINNSNLEESLKASCKTKLSLIENQKADLKYFLQELIEDMYSKRRAFKIYKQFKTYNNPKLRTF